MYEKKHRTKSLPEIWREHAADLRDLLNRQNAALLAAARERDALLGSLSRWAAWRKGQCDCDETLSQEEKALLELCER